MRRWTMTAGAVIGLALFLVGLTGSTVFAWPSALAGRPSQLQSGAPLAYYVWTDGSDGIHLSTTTDQFAHVLHAVIRTDGVIQNVDQTRLETGDEYTILDGGHVLDVVFHTDGHIDNVQWNVAGGTFMRFNLNVDGHDVAPDRIFLGADGHHPAMSEFRVPC